MSLSKIFKTQKYGDLLQFDGYCYHRVSKSENKGGSIGWRCQYLRTNYGCKATCTTKNGVVTRHTKVVHTCPRATEVDIAIHSAKRGILEHIKTAPTSSHPKNVFDSVLGETVKNMHLPDGYYEQLAAKMPVRYFFFHFRSFHIILLFYLNLLRHGIDSDCAHIELVINVC